MKRIYFLIPTVKSAIRICDSLKTLNIKSEDMHVLVKDQEKLEMVQIPSAGVVQTSDVLHALKQGASVGVIVGLLTGLIVVLFPPEGLSLGIGTVIGVGIFGLLFGAWASTLVGISVPNPAIEKFEKAVEAGGILMLVDIPEVDEKKIIEFMKKNHPEASLHGMKL